MKSIDPEAPPAPKRLYKYRAFSPFVLNELCNSETYFAPPATFNDPLDTPAVLTNGGAIDTKLALLKRVMSEQRSSRSFDEQCGEYRYLSTEYGDREAAFSDLVVSHIQRCFLAEVQALGVLSLASSWSCPLMWSHYAAQHQGICLEYSTEAHEARNFLPVQYDLSRAIELADLAAWKIDGNEAVTCPH